MWWVLAPMSTSSFMTLGLLSFLGCYNSYLWPSLILRKMGEGETLWAVAKQYRATREGILSVNELADESQITPDRLLLIPRAR